MVDEMGMVEPDRLLGDIEGREDNYIFQILMRDEFVSVVAHRFDLLLEGCRVKAEVTQQLRFELLRVGDNVSPVVLARLIGE